MNRSDTTRWSVLVLLAALLVALLTAAWAWRDWGALSAFRLPDNDDMMRLAQVRDWLNGQAFADMSQHRLGPVGGASMHWSRLADMGPAAIIVALTPLVGRIAAEQAMLVLYPGLLFFGALLMGARIARRLVPQAVVITVVVLALAFPAQSLFIPGRIDHHGLQILLTLWFVERLIAPATLRDGALAGLAAALSLAVGLETLPLVLAGMLALFLRFVLDGEGVRGQLAGFGLMLASATALFLLTLRPWVWPAAWCDGFTPASSDATLIAAAYFVCIALAAPRLPNWRTRLVFGGLLGAAVLPVVHWTSGVCLTGPYGAMDPLLQDLWMSRVGEALGMSGQDSLGVAVSYGGFGLMGALALVLILRRGAWREAKWQSFAIVFGLGVLLTIFQIRAIYVVSALAAVPVAGLIQRVRATSASPLARVGIWIASAGLTWNLLGLAMAPQVLAGKLRGAQCTGPDQVEALARLPRGRVIAPLDSAAYVIGGTPHAVVAAPYHRNNVGNLAMYHFFLGTPAEARAIATEWQVRYVVLCPQSFTDLGPMAD